MPRSLSSSVLFGCLLLGGCGLIGVAAVPGPTGTLGTDIRPPAAFRPPFPEIGDRAVYRIEGSDKYRQDFVFAIADDSITLTYYNEDQGETSENCNRTYRAPDFSPPLRWTGCSAESDATQEVTVTGSLLPLAVGNRATYRIRGRSDSGRRWSLDRQCVVSGARRIDTGVGPKDTLMVTCDDEWVTSTRYVAPDVPLPVALEVLDKRNGRRVVDRLELYERYRDVAP